MSRFVVLVDGCPMMHSAYYNRDGVPIPRHEHETYASEMADIYQDINPGASVTIEWED